MTVFITGGCKNGKSSFALRAAEALSGTLPRWYVATLIPMDEEDRLCVQRHRAARAGRGFHTAEEPYFPSHCAGQAGEGVFLLDSVTSLLTNYTFCPPAGESLPPGERAERELAAFLEKARHAVLVSDYIYCDGDYDGLTERFKRDLARLDRFLAGRCDCVVELCCGLPVVRKGAAVWS